MRATTPILASLVALCAGCDDFSPMVGEPVDSGVATVDTSTPAVDTGASDATSLTDVAEVGDADGSVDTELDAAPPPVVFAKDIRPLMNRAADDPTGKGCRCHYPSSPTHIGLDLGGLDLSTLGTLREGGGSSGSRIVIPGDPDGSVIVQKLKGIYPLGTRMPKNGPPFWTDAEIALVRRWIAEGAKGKDTE